MTAYNIVYLAASSSIDRYYQSMDHLRAERRPDKNGNMVTRWIRQLTNRKKAVAIPAPSPVRYKFGRSNSPEVTKLCVLLSPGELPDLLAENVECLANYDLELLERITAAAHSDPLELNYWQQKLIRGNMLSNGSQKSQELNLDECRIALVVNPVLRRIAANGGDVGMEGAEPHQFRGIVTSLFENGRITNPPEDLVKAVTLIAYVRGLHTGHSWLEADGGYLAYKTIENDAVFIAENIEKVEPLIPELRTRKSHDPEVMQMLWDSPSPSLAEGML